MELSINLISIILFYGLIGYLIFKKRKKIEFHKIFFLYKTKTGINLIDKLAKNRFWKYWGYLGIPVGFIGMVGIFWLLLVKVPGILLSTSPEKTVQLLLPGVGSGSLGPFMFMPFWTFLICIIILILVHEGAHGIIARVHKIKIKSTGVGMFTIIPLAFVEPDEEQLEKASVLTQLSVFAAGPFANICTAIIAVLISIFILAPAASNLLTSDGLTVVDVKVDFPADLSGIQSDDKILAVNGIETLDSAQFVSELSKIKPGDDTKILLQDREVNLKTVAKPENAEIAYLGVSFKPNFVPVSDTFFGNLAGKMILYLTNLFYWITLLNFGIALVNLLPLGPVDGGRMIKTIFDKYIKNPQLAKILWLFVSMTALVVLLINLFGPVIL